MKRGTQPDILTETERYVLRHFAAGGTREEQTHAIAMLEGEKGILPPPESIEWFLSRFRIGGRK